MAVYNSRLYAGTFNYPDGAEVWEYAPDPGELDPGFGTGGVVIYDGGNDDAANGVAIQPDNKIVVAGYTYNDISYSVDVLVMRYNSDGSRDTNFGTYGIVKKDIFAYNDFARGVAIQPDGKIVVAGYAGKYSMIPPYFEEDVLVVRYDSDGIPDTSFSADGVVTWDGGSGDDKAYDVAIDADGKIVVAGETEGSLNALVLRIISGVTCTYSIAPGSQSFGSAGRPGTVSVTPNTDYCSWTAASNDSSWITITSGSSGTGSETVNYSVSANGSTSPRAGSLIIAWQVFTITQDGKSENGGGNGNGNGGGGGGGGTTTTSAPATTTTTSTQEEPLPESEAAAFTAAPLSGPAPLKVKFINTYRGDIKSYDWNFGDRGISAQESPEHVYTEPGVYTASLTVTTEGGLETCFSIAKM